MPGLVKLMLSQVYEELHSCPAGWLPAIA